MLTPSACDVVVTPRRGPGAPRTGHVEALCSRCAVAACLLGPGPRASAPTLVDGRAESGRGPCFSAWTQALGPRATPRAEGHACRVSLSLGPQRSQHTGLGPCYAPVHASSTGRPHRLPGATCTRAWGSHRSVGDRPVVAPLSCALFGTVGPFLRLSGLLFCVAYLYRYTLRHFDLLGASRVCLRQWGPSAAGPPFFLSAASARICVFAFKYIALGHPALVPYTLRIRCFVFLAPVAKVPRAILI